MPGADRSAELAMMMREDPQFAADVTRLQGQQANANAVAQASMLDAVAARKERVQKTTAAGAEAYREAPALRLRDHQQGPARAGR
jgi:hypothetical protein